jgi:hypothetical protein
MTTIMMAMRERLPVATTSAERMRALGERARRGVKRFTIDVSEDDLRAIAKRGYEGAVTTDHDQQAHGRPVSHRRASANLTG